MSAPRVGEFTGNNRFRIIKRLGGGGFGVVYSVYDLERKEEVALKTLRQQSPKSLYRFKKEFRALADIEHENLVKLHELLCDDNQWFFTMELVRGMNFRDYVLGPGRSSEEITARDQPSDKNPTLDFSKSSGSNPTDVRPRNVEKPPQTDYARLTSALGQLARGLTVLHQAGKLHRDIKPSNVRVSPEGRVVLMDFGLVTEEAPENLIQSIDFVGSPAYMSPEQGTGKPVSQASDWYALGVMLFEALTGQLPFFGGFTDVMLSKQQLDAPIPAKMVPGIPRYLNQLCVDLLSRDPGKRPKGPEVLERLGSKRVSSDTGSAPTNRRFDRLFGREKHLGALYDALDAVKADRSVAVLVTGHFGMGKTTLVRHFLSGVQRDDPEAVVLRGRCYRQESVPFKGLDSLVDTLTRYLVNLSPIDAALLMPRDILALARLFPVLRRVEVIEGATNRVLNIPDPQELRKRAFVALKELLARIADRQKLVLFVDDLQWGDADSAALLTDLLRPPEAPGLMMIVGFQLGEESNNLLLQRLFATPNGTDVNIDLHQISVGPLAPAEAQRAVESLFPALSMTREETLLIARESHGIPFYIHELARYAKEESRPPLDAEETINPEEKLQLVLVDQIAALNAGALRLLQLIAVAGRPLEMLFCYNVSRLSSDDRDPLHQLLDYKLVRMNHDADGEELELAHDRVRETVIGQLADEDIKQLHLKLADALEEAGQADSETLARHYFEAGELRKASKYFGYAAARAAHQLAFHRAVDLYTMALKVRPKRQTPPLKLMVKLAETLANLGRGEAAARWYLDALEQAGDIEISRLQRRAAAELLRSGHIDRGNEVMRDVLSRLQIKWPASAKRARISLLQYRTQLRLRGLNYTEQARAAIDPLDIERIEATWAIAIGFSLVDVIRGADFQSRNLLLSLKSGDPYMVSRAMAMEAGFVSMGGNRSNRRARDLLNRAKEIAKRIDDPHARGLVRLNRGIAAFFDGNWKEARKQADRADNLLRERCVGVVWETSSSRIIAFMSYYYLGELARLRQQLPQTLREARDRGDMYSIATLRTFLNSTIILADDRPEQALRETGDAMSGWSEKGYHLQHFLQLLAQGQIELYRSRGQAAYELVSEHWARLEESQLFRIQLVRCEMHFLRARAALAAAAAGIDPSRMLNSAEKDAGKLEKEKTDRTTPMAMVLRAGICAVRGDMEQAALLLAAAERGFDSADMGLFGAATRRRRGEAISSKHGRSLIQSANAWMKRETIKNPGRFCAMLTPGFRTHMEREVVHDDGRISKEYFVRTKDYY